MDKQKLQKIYEENASIVYKYLFCLTHNADLSEELTQETFYQAIKGIHNFRGECKISVWLCQIAKRQWYKELNAKKHQTLPLQEMDCEPIATGDPESDYFTGAEKMEIFRLLHNFEPVTKEVMYLRLAGDLSFAQIGNIMGKTENWARVTFYRGKQKLVKGRETWNQD